MTVWDDVIARARGLSTHLLSRAALVALARSPDVEAVAAGLAARGLVPASARTPHEVDRWLRRARAARLATLARWCGDRREVLSVVFDDEDRRNLDCILRRVAAGASGAETVLGLTPTPRLPERALRTLAEQRDPAALSSLLVAWGHPFGSALHAVGDLAARERALHLAFAGSATRAARRGDPALRAFTGALLDVHNALQLRVSLSQPPVSRDAEAWLPGGARLDRATWARLLQSEPGAVGVELERLLGPELGAAVADDAPGRSELAVLRVLASQWRVAARIEPLSTAPILWFTLALRAEAADLRTVVWGVALGAPAGVIAARLVTP